MKLPQLVDDARQVVAVATVASAGLVAQGIESGTAEHWITGLLTVASAVLAAVKIPPSPKSAARALKRAAKNSIYPKG